MGEEGSGSAQPAPPALPVTLSGDRLGNGEPESAGPAPTLHAPFGWDWRAQAHRRWGQWGQRAGWRGVKRWGCGSPVGRRGQLGCSAQAQPVSARGARRCGTQHAGARSSPLRASAGRAFVRRRLSGSGTLGVGPGFPVSGATNGRGGDSYRLSGCRGGRRGAGQGRNLWREPS